jgi:hypothetical protein
MRASIPLPASRVDPGPIRRRIVGPGFRFCESPSSGRHVRHVTIQWRAVFVRPRSCSPAATWSGVSAQPLRVASNLAIRQAEPAATQVRIAMCYKPLLLSEGSKWNWWAG